MSGAVNSLTVTLDANGQWVGNNANFVFVLSATAPVTVQLTRMLTGAGVETFAGVQAGLQIGRVQPWTQGKITGAVGTVVTLYYGFQQVREDFTNFQQQIATIAGIVAVAALPSSSFVDTAEAAIVVGAPGVVTIAANLARRRITIGNTSYSTNIIRVSQSGATGCGIEIQPGQYQEFQTTAALKIRNDNGLGTAANATWWAEEEL